MYSRRWLIAAVAAWMLASACSQFNTNLSLQTSSSSVSFTSPATQTAGGSDFTLTVTGTGFVTGAFILWNGTELADTVFVSGSTMTAVIPAADIATPGPIQVSVEIPGSAVSATSNINNTANYANTTEVSNFVYFNINAAPGPLPVISSVSASTTGMAATPYCSPNGFTLTVNGSNFTSGAVVNWTSATNPSTIGTARVTNLVSSTQLTAAILPSDTAFPGTASVSVSNASGTSTAVQVTMTTPSSSLPAPSITSMVQSLSLLTPPEVPIGTATSLPAGSPMFTLAVNGSSLLPCSTVLFGPDAQVTAFASPAQLNATIPASEVFSAGTGGTPRTVSVTVSTITSAGGGGVSGPITFTVTPPPS